MCRVPVFLFNRHGIHGRTQKNKNYSRNTSVFFRGFRGHNIYPYQVKPMLAHAAKYQRAVGATKAE